MPTYHFTLLPQRYRGEGGTSSGARSLSVPPCPAHVNWPASRVYCILPARSINSGIAADSRNEAINGRLDLPIISVRRGGDLLRLYRQDQSASACGLPGPGAPVSPLLNPRQSRRPFLYQDRLGSRVDARASHIGNWSRNGNSGEMGSANRPRLGWFRQNPLNHFRAASGRLMDRVQPGRIPGRRAGREYYGRICQ
jgi:hypothetical protein